MNLTLEQKLAIHELLARAAYAFDQRDMKMLEDSFAKEASFTMRIAGGDLIGPFEGRDAIMKLMANSMAEQTDVRRHIISNIFFKDNAEPTVVSNLTLVATDKGEIQLLTAGVYYDTLVEQAGSWCILQRHIDLDKAH
jgi:3-phenylpropionate/cinnamic acid dioxygenase small subunit